MSGGKCELNGKPDPIEGCEVSIEQRSAAYNQALGKYDDYDLDIREQRKKTQKLQLQLKDLKRGARSSSISTSVD